MKKLKLSKRTEMVQAFWRSRGDFWTQYIRAEKENPDEEQADPEPYLFVDRLLMAGIEAGWVDFDPDTATLTWLGAMPEEESPVVR